MKTYEIRTVIRVTQEQIDDMLADAFEHGISHWCGEIREELPPEEKTKYFSDNLTRGGSLGLYVKDNQEWRYLNLEKVLEALEQSQFNFEDYDSIDCDNVIQRALFGEVN